MIEKLDDGGMIVMVPTEKVFDKNLNNRLVVHEGKLKYCQNGDMMRDGIPQHIYVLSNESIKENDWKFNIKINAFWQHKREGKDLSDELKNAVGPDTKKIIATTNDALTVVKFTESGNVINDGIGIPLDRPSKHVIAHYMNEYNSTTQETA